MDDTQFKHYLYKKNSFSRNNDSQQAFGDYFNECISICQSTGDIDSKTEYLREAEMALEIFGERTELNDEKVSLILSCRTTIGKEYAHISDIVNQIELQNDEDTSVNGKESTEVGFNVIEHNNSILDQLASLKNSFSDIHSHNKLDKLLEYMQFAEDSLDKDSFTNEQKTRYKNICNDLSKLVSDAMESINYNKEKEYNEKALYHFKKVFDVYKHDEKELKEIDNAFRNAISPLFGYDSSKLFPEVQIYYNQVFSYIFSKLSDDDKFELVKMSLEATKV